MTDVCGTISFVSLIFVQGIDKLAFAETFLMLVLYLTEYEDDFEPEDGNEEEAPTDVADQSESPAGTNLSVNAMELIDSKVSEILQSFGVTEREESQANGVCSVFFLRFTPVCFNNVRISQLFQLCLFSK